MTAAPLGLAGILVGEGETLGAHQSRNDRLSSPQRLVVGQRADHQLHLGAGFQALLRAQCAHRAHQALDRRHALGVLSVAMGLVGLRPGLQHQVIVVVRRQQRVPQVLSDEG